MKTLIFLATILILSSVLISCGSIQDEAEGLLTTDTIILQATKKVETKEDRIVGESSGTALLAESIIYLGAFLLPDDGDAEREMFSYGGQALCYNPHNNSLFITGHNWFALVAEISIPQPVKSKDINELSQAQVINEFSDIKGSLFNKWTMEIPRVGMEVVGDKLFFCFGEHYEEDTSKGTHGYTDLGLSEARNVCVVGDYLYSTNDYMFMIPDAYINMFAGHDLLTGRFRDGGWSGMGPSLFAISSENIIGSANNERIEATVIIKYDDSYNGDDGFKMNDYSHADSWTGGAVVSCDAGEAIVLTGTHGYGETWYGFSNGVVYPTEGDVNAVYPDVPDYPHDERGWWNDDLRACIAFYDINQAAKAANGEIESFEVQPYAFLDLSEYMILERDETAMQYLGGVAYDNKNNFLYVLELFVEEGNMAVHVFTFE